MRRDFKAYHRSLVAELNAVQNRVRNLIGDAHWGTDGAHKESVLRSVLRKHVPESLHVGSGFVCFPPRIVEGDTSGQLDILVTEIAKPTLYKEGDLVIATPDSVVAAIEVKSEASNVDFASVLTTLSDLAEQVRNCRGDDDDVFKVGLFVFACTNADSPSDQRVLTALREASRGRVCRAVNWVAVGPNRFFRFWEDGATVDSEAQGEVWHSYELQRLAQSYFIANVVWDTCPSVHPEMRFAWFPIERSQGTKERYRRWYCSLHGGTPQEFRHNG